jgi:hypothetical protein
MHYFHETLDFVKQYGTMLTGAAAALAFLLPFVKSIYEYSKENSLKRFEKYQAITRQWNENADTQEIVRLLDEDPELLTNYDVKKKEDFIDRYEDVAVMYESGLMRRSITFYMFGYYAIRCYESKHFRAGIDLNSPYYTLFRRFAKEMKQIEGDVAQNRDNPEKWKFNF